MSINDQDTDPSTPLARRPSGRAGPSAAPPAHGSDSTEPPVGRASEPSGPARRPPLGISAQSPSGQPPPAPAPTFGRTPESPPQKDSVELLLEGMAEFHPDRPRTTPQTDGEASAAYHAQHGVHGPGRSSRLESSKVLVSSGTAPTLTVGVPRPADGAAGLSRAQDPTVVTSVYTERRVLLALVAGCLVVLAIFIGLQLATLGGSSGSSAQPISPPPHFSETAAGASPSPSVDSSAVPAVAASAPWPASTGSAPHAAVPGRARSPKHPERAPSEDLGEFKTSF